MKELILEWAKDRNLLNYSFAPKQQLKLIEECGEIAQAIIKNDIDKIKDGIGDVFVVLTILKKQRGDKDTSTNFDFISDPHNIIFQILNSAIEFENCDLAISYLHDLANSLDVDLNECVELAYNEIKNRKGKTINGSFIKE